MSSEYPQRDGFFAHRFVRLLQKSCAAMDIGQNACLLLCYIAHTEDAMRYSGAVKFWNEQLMTTLGFKSPKQLNDARTKAVESGWLVYVRPGHREVGRYWVIVPPEYEDMVDATIEPIHSEYGTNSGMNKERKAERIGDGKRNEKVTESGKPSNPIPVPNPKPKEDVVFEQFWKAYPRRTAKGNARKAWQKAIKSVDTDTIISAALKYAASVVGTEAKYIAHPASWLNAERWEDEPETVKRKILPGTPEWSARSIKWLDKVPEWQAMANRGEITDQEFNRRVNEARTNADKEME